MGHTGTGPRNSSNDPTWNSGTWNGKHQDLGADIEIPPPMPLGYQQEMCSVPKDVVYAAIAAIQSALGYMSQIKTDVPQWQKAVEQDVVRMQCALSELRNLAPDSPR